MARELLIERPMEEVVMHYAKNAMEAGLDGVVCSPLESEQVHAACGAQFLTVTPAFVLRTARRATRSASQRLRAPESLVQTTLSSADDHGGGRSRSRLPQMRL